MPTEAEMESPEFHPAEELPQGPIPTGLEFRAMRAILGLSLAELAEKNRIRVHHLAAIESRRIPRADVHELVLHTVLMKLGVRWHPDLARLFLAVVLRTDVQDMAQLLDDTGSADLADLDEMAGTRVRVTAGPDHVRLQGPDAEVCMAFPLDIEEFWDVVEDLATGPWTSR